MRNRTLSKEQLAFFVATSIGKSYHELIKNKYKENSELLFKNVDKVLETYPEYKARILTTISWYAQAIIEG